MGGLNVLRKLAKRIGGELEGLPVQDDGKGGGDFTSGDSFAIPQFNEGGSIDDQMKSVMDIGPEEEETHTMPDGTVMPGATHEEYMNEQDMLPDDDMEDDYLDFIMSEALSQEEEQMLTSKLEQDEDGYYSTIEQDYITINK